MGKENRNYSNVSAVIKNAIDAFNTIEQTLSTMGAKTSTNATIESTTNYLSANELNSIIENQLQLKPTQQKNITSSSGTLVDSNGITQYSSYTVRSATVGTVTTSISENSMFSAGAINTNGTTEYYPITLTEIGVNVPLSRQGWYAGGNYTSSTLTFNIEAAKFTFNPSNGTVTCTSAGYVKETAAGNSITSLQTAQLTVGSTVSTLTGDVFETTNPTANLSNYYPVTATPAHNLTGFRAGVITSTSEVTNGSDVPTTRYIKKSTISGGTTSSNTTTLKPGQTASIGAGYLNANKSIIVSTNDADITADYVLSGKKGYGANNTLITGNIPIYGETTTVNLSSYMSQSGNKVTVTGTLTPTGYYDKAKFSGTLTLSSGSVTVNDPTYVVYAGSSSVNNIVLTDEPSGNYYRMDISSTATRTAGYIDNGISSLAQPKSVYIAKKDSSNISVTGATLTKGAGNLTFNTGYDGDVFKTSGSGGYPLTINASGYVSMGSVKETHPAGYYSEQSTRTVITGTENFSSNVKSQTIRVPSGSAGNLGITVNSHTMAAEAGDFSGSTQTSTHETLSLNQLESTPPSGVYYKLKSELKVTPTISGTTAGFIKTFPSGSQSTYTKYYYIPQATFKYKHDSTSGANFIECKTAGYYPTGILNIEDDTSTSEDDIDYADVIATLSNANSIVLSGSSVPSGDYEIIISKDSSTDPGYISGSNGTLSLKTKYYIKKGAVSSSVKSLTSSISVNNSMTLHDSTDGLNIGYYTLTPSATATTEMTLTPGYIPSKGTSGSKTANGTIKYINAGAVNITGGAKTPSTGYATFEATTIQRDTNSLFSGTNVLEDSAPESGTYYEINISGKGNVSVGDVNYSITEGYIKNLGSTKIINGGTISSNTATNKKYVSVSTLTNSLSTINGDYTATNVQYGKYLKISKGYYPFDRYVQSTCNVAAVSPTVSNITATQIGPSGSAYTFTTTLSGTLNVNVATNGYITSSNGAITPKNINEFSAKSVNISVGKGSVSGANLSFPNNSTSTVSADKGYAKLIATPSGTASGYVKVSAQRAAAVVDTEGYVTSTDVNISTTTNTAYIAAVKTPTITATATNVSGSSTVGGISTFSDSDGSVATAGAKSGGITVSGTVSGSGAFKDKYMLNNVSVSGTATGSATANIHSNATGENVDIAFTQLYRCLLGLSYETTTVNPNSGNNS